jgi:hypothetical protein
MHVLSFLEDFYFFVDPKIPIFKGVHNETLGERICGLLQRTKVPSALFLSTLRFCGSDERRFY